MRFKNVAPVPLALLVFFLLQTMAWAQFTPYFENYDLSQYNAGNQNWGVSKAVTGNLYVANNKGLLEYDGLTWQLHALPNKTTVRSVLAVGDKIYSGSYEEFGYWERNEYGQLIYTSLSQGLHVGEFLNEEFWQIISTGNSIVFRSFLHLYIYENGSITKVKPPSTILSCSLIEGHIYVATLEDGIFKLQDHELIPFVTDHSLQDVKIIAISKIKNQFMIATSLEGLLLYQNGQLRPWNAEISRILRQQQLNAFSLMANGHMVFGTIKNGVYVTNPQGEVVFHIHKENGLLNNTILSQLVDENEQLWLGLDNGLATVDMHNSYLFYNDVSGNLGAVYDVINYENTVYIGSNTGLFYIDEAHNLQFIEGSQGQVWDLEVIEGDLMCGHNNGTYLVKNKTIERISNYTGGWMLQKVMGAPSTYIQGTYAGLVRFKKEHAGWQVKHLGHTTIPSRFLAFEDSHTAWVAHAYKGLYRVKFDAHYDAITDIKSYEAKGLYSPYNTRVYSLKNDICIKTNEGWQKYEPLLDTIVAYPLLDKTFGKSGYMISEKDLSEIAVKNEKTITFKSFPDNGSRASLSDRYYKNRLVIGYENISHYKDSLRVLALNNGFMLFDKVEPKNSLSLQQPYFESIKIDKKRRSIQSVDRIELANDYQTLRLTFAAPKSKDFFFEYAITNNDTARWIKMDGNKMEFSNINHGNYRFQVRTAHLSGQSSVPLKFLVSVVPPWYYSQTGYLLFGVVLCLTLVLFYTLHRRKIERQKRRMQYQFDLEQQKIIREKTIENDKRLVELKNQSLKNEVKLKSKQLANTAMALVKKNETLLELKNEIAQHKNSFGNMFSYKKIIKTIDNSISHKDEWKLFEHNFNQVHEEFFTGLKARHPNLTSKDLRICAYIKMNLSTKEIAPLLNISVRGVETQRYRLKGKLSLDSDQSLTDYLQNFI